MSAAKPIAVIQGAASTEVQALLRDFIARLPPGVRVAGAVEDPAPAAGGPCSAGELNRLGHGQRFRIMQDLGPAATSCRLDAEGVVSACDGVLADIDAGCDLVVLSKFGKIESERSGLAPAFARAMEAGLPLLTSVSPRFTEAWDRFAAPFYVVLPARLEAIESWWRNVRADAETTAG